MSSTDSMSTRTITTRDTAPLRDGTVDLETGLVREGTAPELQLGVDGFVHGEVPGEDLGQMAVAVNRCQARVGRAAQVASIDHVEAQAAQQFWHSTRRLRYDLGLNCSRRFRSVGR